MRRCHLVLTLVAAALLLARSTPPTRAGDATPLIEAVDHQRTTIYHSPQTPGFTSWTGTWLMPDGSLMVAFTQATGPLTGRPRTPKPILDQLSWAQTNPDYDMNGLDLRNVHLRSSDGGQTWRQVSADSFRSCMNGVSGMAETALPDGTLLRAVWGHYLPFDEVPRTGYLQRSVDGSRTWGKPEVFLDPQRFTAWPTRLRVLRDGRLLVAGGLSHVPAGTGTRLDHFVPGTMEPLLMVSADHGKTWSRPIAVVPPELRKGWSGEEYDLAELPNGDLLCVFRTKDPTGKAKGEVRYQGLLKKTADTWVPQDVRPAPFPHSGHPNLLATREGPVLHLATSGVHYTTDAGRSWHRLQVPGTRYYPTSVQTADGRIYVFAHVGGDDPYGKVDQSIVMDTFRLKVP